ncbi:phytoene/squalene synthase family protein [Luteimonas sp. RD2P54]|uniref:Phytoene/squalene synthase family protein n=1 Tax=Luteimonas endophytica TaxID=3042023 RepID=A0ABT6J426_9GAMM|nr:squalene/phytoene synthase family protein [Luteimonas endophytica]MDH5821575.1 phytoene/squalene synthase family protein [Luteimonas endophytica]
MDPSQAEGFVAKWRSRWPEWQIAAAFLPEPARAPVAAWFALLQELTDAAWGAPDPTPGLAKLAWWQEELQGWSRGARRHPLGERLQRHPAPWLELGRALSALPATRELGASATLQALQALGRAAAECELWLPHGEDAADGETTAATLARCLTGERVLLAGQRSEALWLLQQWPHPAGGPRARRIHAALLRARLRDLSSGRAPRPLPAWRVLPLAWRSARGGA